MKAYRDPAPLGRTYETASPAPGGIGLSSDHETQVAVIGGGICGVTCALHLAEAGFSVAVLERDQVGSGGSGRALGLVLPISKISTEKTMELFGAERGKRVAEAIMTGPTVVEDLVRRHDIACDLTTAGWLQGAHARVARKQIEAQVRYWQGRRQDVELVEGEQLHRLSGSQFYSAAMLDRRARGLNPLAYTRGLASAAGRAGAVIFSNTRVVALQSDPAGWVLVAEGGARLKAQQVIVATDAYTDDLLPKLRRAIVPVRAYQVVSEPIPPKLRQIALPLGHILTDTRRLYGGVRVTADFRVQLSVDGPPFTIGGAARRDQATDRLTRLFPELGHLRWTDEWSGWVGITKDHIPHVNRLETGLWAVTGFNGRGIAMATLLGRDMARRIHGWPEAEMCIPETPLRPLLGHFLTSSVADALIRWYRVRDSIDLRGGR